MQLLKRFFEELKQRKVRKWLAIYTSSALTIIGLLHLFSLRYQFSSYIFDIPLILLITGFFIVIIMAWHHGKAGYQKIKVIEVLLYLIFLSAGISLIVFFLGFPFKMSQSVRVESNSIAVLPFKNLSDSKDDEFFSDGVTEDIIARLSKISGLKVISRTSVMKYKNTDKNIREIGSELGVESVLEGSIRRVNNRVRIVGQLINASDDGHIWTETYDRELEDIFSIQSEIAERIAAALQTNLLPLEKELIDEKSTDNIAAYTYYLKGRHFYNNYTNEDNNKAIDLFKKALEIDQNYALALSGLADAYNQRVMKYLYSEEWLDSAMVFSNKALQINSNLPEAYKALALTYDNLGEKSLAIVNYEKAIKLNPNYASAILNYGLIKLARGKYDESFYWFNKVYQLEPDNIFGIISLAKVYKFLLCDSLAIYWGKKAVALDPDNAVSKMILSEFYLYAGRFGDAAKSADESLAQNEKLLLNWFFKSQVEAALGNYKLAKEYLDNYMKLAGIDKPEYFYAYYLLKLNETEKAMQILHQQKVEYIEFLNEFPNDATLNDYNGLAEIYAILNEKENAIKAWEKSIEIGWLDIRRNTLFPYFEYLKAEPEYQRLIKIMRSRVKSLKSEINTKHPQYAICN
jgi:TolB-like protein/Tfp pilus assembly protein PilF